MLWTGTRWFMRMSTPAVAQSKSQTSVMNQAHRHWWDCMRAEAVWAPLLAVARYSRLLLWREWQAEAPTSGRIAVYRTVLELKSADDDALAPIPAFACNGALQLLASTRTPHWDMCSRIGMFEKEQTDWCGCRPRPEPEDPDFGIFDLYNDELAACLGRAASVAGERSGMSAIVECIDLTGCSDDDEVEIVTTQTRRRTSPLPSTAEEGPTCPICE
ncbi:hypothetical protein HaLaN_03971 [Haematococcus lacustris]|uniref:Uncharacterized protein n=1 Tax=Haematococcus lacustris TaxID=44745 RepID=A0A699YPR5_HAELA|nr:hypothetical protein HaLaN_03971 [Haematococcus lacustris]